MQDRVLQRLGMMKHHGCLCEEGPLDYCGHLYGGTQPPPWHRSPCVSLPPCGAAAPVNVDCDWGRARVEVLERHRGWPVGTASYPLGGYHWMPDCGDVRENCIHCPSPPPLSPYLSCHTDPTNSDYDSCKVRLASRLMLSLQVHQKNLKQKQRGIGMVYVNTQKYQFDKCVNRIKLYINGTAGHLCLSNPLHCQHHLLKQKILRIFH